MIIQKKSLVKGAIGTCLKMAHNTKIDEIKVIQNHYEAFIHRSFYTKNFFHSKKNFIEIEIPKYKGFRFCKKSNFRKNKTGLRRITGQT